MNQTARPTRFVLYKAITKWYYIMKRNKIKMHIDNITHPEEVSMRYLWSNFFSFTLVFLSLFGGSSYAFTSGHISKDTTWSTDVTITGDVYIDSGITLTIVGGVVVSIATIDNNADGIGDIAFNVNGTLKTLSPSSSVVFRSLDSSLSAKSWQGIVVTSTATTLLNAITVRHARLGFSFQNTKNINAYNLLATDCYTGVNVANSTNLLLYNIRALHNDSCGVNIINSRVNISNSQFDTNGVIGARFSGSDTCNISYSNFCKNGRYGIYLESNRCIFSFCNIINNGSTGVLTKIEVATGFTSAITNSNIHSNMSSTADTINVESYGYSAWEAHSTSLWCRVPSRTTSLIFQSKQDYKLWTQNNGVSTWIYLGNWAIKNANNSTLESQSGSLNPYPRPLFPRDSMKLETSPQFSGGYNQVAGYGYVKVTALVFGSPMQVIYAPKTGAILDLRQNYWGQISGVDTLVSSQSLVLSSGFQVAAIQSAGYQGTMLVPQINLSVAVISFGRLPVNSKDTAAIIVDNPGKNLLVVQGIASSHSIFNTSCTELYIPPASKDTFFVILSPDSAKSETGILTIPSNVLDKPITEINMSAEVTSANFPPAFLAPMPDTMVIAGTMLARAHPAVDPNVGDTISYSVLSGPQGLTYTNDTIFWQIPTNASTATIILQCSDQFGLSCFDTVIISINHPPQITSTVPDTNLTVGRAYTYDVNAIDPDGHKIYYYLDSLVGSMSISQISGLISFSPTTADTGRHKIKVRVTDSLGASAYQTYHIQVRPQGTGTLVTNHNLLPVSFAVAVRKLNDNRISLQIAVPALNATGSSNRHLVISAFDIRGRLISTILDGAIEPGYHSIVTNLGSRQPAILKIETAGYSETKKLLY